MLELRERIGTCGRAATLRGVPASGGRVTGRARVFDGLRPSAPLRPGDVLVCRALTRGLAAHVCVAAGVVTEEGGILSGPMTAARERSLPAIVAVSGATRRIRDGQIITVDGTNGLVVKAG